MFNPVIVVAIIVQVIVAKFSRIAGAVIGYIITTGILLWGISVYGQGNQIALFGIPLSQPILLMACLVWYGFDTRDFMAARKKASKIELVLQSPLIQNEGEPEPMGETATQTETLELKQVLQNPLIQAGEHAMQCPHSNQEHPEGTQFCPLTGKEILIREVCPDCGKPVDPNWLHCTYCGRTLIQAEGISDQHEAQATGYPQATITTPALSKTKTRSIVPKYPGLMIAGGVGGLLIVALVVLIAVSSGPSAAERNAQVTAVAASVYAAETAGAPAATDVVEPLFAALHDKDQSVRLSAVEALGEIRDARAVEPLIAALKDEDVDVRASAVRALGEIGDVRAFEPLSAALTDEDANVRFRARQALGNMGQTAVEPLIAALKDENYAVRLEAATALGDIGDARAVEPLSAALKDEDASVRLSAVTALGRIGDARAVEPLIAALKDEDANVRLGAVTALGDMGQAAVKPLIALGEDDLSIIAATYYA